MNIEIISTDATKVLEIYKQGLDTRNAQFFNRENNIRNIGEEIGYTQGLGLSYYELV